MVCESNPHQSPKSVSFHEREDTALFHRSRY